MLYAQVHALMIGLVTVVKTETPMNAVHQKSANGLWPLLTVGRGKCFGQHLFQV